MAGSLKTTNYQLSKYAPNDITSWLIDFNGNMDLIDAGMESNKQAAETADDKAANAAAGVTALTAAVQVNTANIEANEKAIAANTASIAELGDEVNNVAIGKSINIGNFVKLESLASGISGGIVKVGKNLIANILITINVGTLHSYDKLINAVYYTYLFAKEGNIFNITPDIPFIVTGVVLTAGLASLGLREITVLYDSARNQTAVALNSSLTTQIAISTDSLLYACGPSH